MPKFGKQIAVVTGNMIFRYPSQASVLIHQHVTLNQNI